MLINQKQLFYTRQYGNETGSSFKNIRQFSIDIVRRS